MSMRLDQFALDSGRSLLDLPEAVNPFTEVDAMSEAALIDARVDLIRRRALLLFDCKGALQIREGNTALLVIDDVADFALAEADAGRQYRYAQLGSWEPSVSHGAWRVWGQAFDGLELSVEGSGGEFFVGDVPGMDEAPPDLTRDSDAAIAEGFVGWHSEFEPLQVARFSVQATPAKVEPETVEEPWEWQCRLEVAWRPPASGGRRSGPPPGPRYMPTVVFADGRGGAVAGEHFSIVIELEEQHGMLSRGRARFLAPALVEPYLHAGASLHVMEGARVVGDAVVLSVGS